MNSGMSGALAATVKKGELRERERKGERRNINSRKKTSVERANDKETAQRREPANEPAAEGFGLGFGLGEAVEDFALRIGLMVGATVFERGGGHQPECFKLKLISLEELPDQQSAGEGNRGHTPGAKEVVEERDDGRRHVGAKEANGAPGHQPAEALAQQVEPAYAPFGDVEAAE